MTDKKTPEITLLSWKQVTGKRRIKAIERLETKCAATDFAICLGSFIYKDVHVDYDSSLKGRTGSWQLTSSDGNGDVCHMSGGRDYDDSFIKDIHYYGSYAGCCLEGIRPVIVIPFYSVPSILKNARRNKNGILEVEYGEYPQYAVDANLGEILEKEFLTGTLRKTGKTYTTYSRGSNEHDESFSPLKHEEFEYGGKKYVRVKLNNSFDQTLTNGVTIHPYDYVQIEVSPITWYVDARSRLLISKTIIASGVRFCDRAYDRIFENTEMYMFLNTYFAKDIIPGAIHKLLPEETAPEPVQEAPEVLKELKRTNEFMRRSDEETERVINNLESLREELRQMGSTPHKSTSEILDALVQRNERRPH